MKEIEGLRKQIDERISFIISPYPPSLLKSAIEYSLFPGGKRIRPILCLLSCSAVNGRKEDALDVASAIELTHTYSLIHDDIMDYDEKRRGKPSVYKKYGIPLAILAGDGLLTLAFEILSDYPLISKEIAKAIGIEGMVFGQAEDILKSQESRVKSQESNEDVNLNKTAKLFMASCVSGGIIGGGNKEQIDALREFGLNFGLLFQLKDDLDDKRINLEDYKKNSQSFLNKTTSSLSIFKEKGDFLLYYLKIFKPKV
ncbi:MAG: polyprenyl synthetase family protein [bacterium]